LETAPKPVSISIAVAGSKVKKIRGPIPKIVPAHDELSLQSAAKLASVAAAIAASATAGFVSER
jgi:hypothetical protein